MFSTRLPLPVPVFVLNRIEDPENPYNPAGSELFPFDQKLDSGFGVLLNAKRTEKIESNVSYQPH